ncbi:MAG: hypothetical protein HYV26_13670, partial [Candidatus Hydrogenedentes bacterium]|nr:hypothetical protein [Candidatus Hydrogenedentota bacterium]
GFEDGIIAADRFRHSKAFYVGYNPFVSCPYDNCKTSKGHGFIHEHKPPETGFPIPYTLPVAGSITQAESDSYWKAAAPSHRPVSSSLLEYNCHGYMTGLNFMVENLGGISIILADDYLAGDDSEGKAPYHSKVGGFLMARNHSYKINTWIPFCEGPICVFVPASLREKWETSPIMELDWPETFTATEYTHYNYISDFDIFHKIGE